MRLRRILALSASCAVSLASSVSLSDFQSLDGEDVSLGCQIVYDSSIPGCSTSDFSDGSGCSNSCIRGVQTISNEINAACGNADVDSDSLLGIALEGDLVGTLCPNAATTTSTTAEQTTSTTSTKKSTSTTEKTTESTTSTKKSTTTTEKSSTTSTSSTTEKTSSTTKTTTKSTSSTSSTSTSSSSSSSSVQTTSQQATTSSSTSSSTTKTTKTSTSSSTTSTSSSSGGESAQDQQIAANKDSGGGSPFDIVAVGSAASFTSPLDLTTGTIILPVFIWYLLR